MRTVTRLALALSLLVLCPTSSLAASTIQDEKLALLRAAYEGRVETVTRLLDRGIDPNAKAEEGLTALMAAASGGHLEVVTVLLDRSADVDAQDVYGATALMVASLEGHADVVNALIEGGADVNASAFQGQTALIIATVNARGDIVGALLEAGADSDAGNRDGDTPLILAARRGHTGVVQALLERGVDVNAANEAGRTAWMEAALAGHRDVTLLLQEAGASYSEPLAMAIEGEHLALQGHITQALEAYSEAQALDATLAIPASSWSRLCLYGSSWGSAADVMPACERAVALAPADEAGRFRQVRGIAKALTGDSEAAIADLESFAAWTRFEYSRAETEGWIGALRAGENPFTQEVLDHLRRRWTLRGRR
ncbi:MAG: ankyrin repeat domain-containing protein [Gemmatimonadota bacterium]|nr:MAG: ankyrin repeat domain-containing protein [Gemmatimonadota bacterium]